MEKEEIKQKVKDNEKLFWQKRAAEMFLGNHKVFYLKEKQCTKEEAIKSFEQESGYLVKDLLNI